MLKDVFVVLKDAAGQSVVAHDLPDVFLCVQPETFGWQRQERNVGGYAEHSRDMRTGQIERSTACLTGLTTRLVSARCRLVPVVLQTGRARALRLPPPRQKAPKM